MEQIEKMKISIQHAKLEKSVSNAQIRNFWRDKILNKTSRSGRLVLAGLKRRHLNRQGMDSDSSTDSESEL